MKRTAFTLTLLLGAAATSAVAENAEPGKLGLQSWGPRVGVATDPDQIVGGVHFDLCEIIKNLRFEPNLELGVGDDHTVLAFTAPVHYLFDVEANLDPYAGGGLVVAFDDHDLPPSSNEDDTNVEIGVKLIGGVEWPLKHGNRFRIELAHHLGGVHEVQVMAGWSF